MVFRKGGGGVRRGISRQWLRAGKPTQGHGVQGQFECNSSIVIRQEICYFGDELMNFFGVTFIKIKIHLQIKL